MKILLTAVNTKYIHSNPAVYGLKAYCERQLQQEAADQENESGRCRLRIAEYTINQQPDEIIRGIYMLHPDVIAFSCYLWNIEYIRMLQTELKKVLPRVQIWLGGPEATYDAEKVLEENPATDLVIYGEGEKAFTELCRKTTDDGIRGISGICGICYRHNDMILRNPPAEPCDMDDLPFFYAGVDMRSFENKILYYESSRGCPYGCSYCLSSVSRQVRFRSLAQVYEDLTFFIQHRVKQVKFVDRTFNCSHERTTAIFRFLTEHDNGITNFHFEIAGDLMNEEEIGLLRRMRPGLVQLEIGVQTVNPETIRAIHRTMNLERLKKNVALIHEQHNVHQHLDLIAGLPYEDIASFRNSFDEVYRMQPDQLQLGFLKVLKGSDMYLQARNFGIVYQDRPPYEVLYTNWISFDDVIYLKKIEQMVELYYNSRMYDNTMRFWSRNFESAFEMYAVLADYYDSHDLFACSHTRISRYLTLRSCIRAWAERGKGRPEGAAADRFEARLDQVLLFDLYLRENLKTRPEFAAQQPQSREYRQQICMLTGLPKTIHIEQFSADLLSYVAEQPQKLKVKGTGSGAVIAFDYEQADPLDHAAKVYEIEFTGEDTDGAGDI